MYISALSQYSDAIGTKLLSLRGSNLPSRMLRDGGAPAKPYCATGCNIIAVRVMIFMICQLFAGLVLAVDIFCILIRNGFMILL